MTEDLEALHYNTAIAALMELVNAMKEAESHSLAIIEDLVIMLAPFAPHFAEESWERLGHGSSVFEARWPVWEDRLIVEDEIEIPVQVNGKTRSKIRIPQGAEEKSARGDRAEGSDYRPLRGQQSPEESHLRSEPPAESRGLVEHLHLPDHDREP